jgi:hypothetical protein
LIIRDSICASQLKTFEKIIIRKAQAQIFGKFIRIVIIRIVDVFVAVVVVNDVV